MKNAIIASSFLGLGLLGLFNLGIKRAGGVIFYNRQTGRVGLSQRAKGMAYHPHKWSATGGLLDKGENYKQAVVREVYEELGIKIIPKGLKELHTIKIRRLNTSELLNYKLYIYVVDNEFKPTNIDRNEVSDFTWKYPKEWKNLHPGLEESFKNLDYLNFNSDDFDEWDDGEYIEPGNYIIKYNGGEIELSWKGGDVWGFNDTWTDMLWAKLDPQVELKDSFSSDSFDLGNCSKCGKPLSAWDLDEQISIIPLRDDKNKRLICKTCRPSFMAEGGNIKVGLVKGRHEMPVNKFIFNEITHENGFAELIVDKLVKDAKKWIEQNCYVGHGRTVELYVTGFTPALTAFIIAWNYMDVDCELIFKHYDNETGKYISQKYRGD